MERSHSHDFTKAPTRPLDAPTSLRTKRLQGAVVELNELEGGGVIQLANRQFGFRTIDLVGSLPPQLGDAVSFVLIATLDGYRAGQVVLDRDPQFIRGQGTLHDCYQSHAQKRAAKRTQQLEAAQASKAPVVDEPSLGPEYRRCDDCQKMVLPKLRRNRNKSQVGAESWLSFCPLCSASLDETSSSGWRRPFLLTVLLAACCSWLLL
ncbi:MAG: hypothetical protein V7752_13095 [Halopseudomonas sp.]